MDVDVGVLARLLDRRKQLLGQFLGFPLVSEDTHDFPFVKTSPRICKANLSKSHS